MLGKSLFTCLSVCYDGLVFRTVCPAETLQKSLRLELLNTVEILAGIYVLDELCFLPLK